MNKILLLGRLGKDPELRFTPAQMAVCKFSFATSERKKDQTGNWVDQTEWHNIVVFGKSAENCGKYLKKGSQAFIEGKIQTRKYQDKEGKDRYITEILANSVQFIGSKSSEMPSSTNEVEVTTSSDEVAAGQALVASLASADSMSTKSTGKSPVAATSFDDDDIPF